MAENTDRNLTAPAALKQGREAERVVAVARRGTLAARAAAAAAREAAKAATATAKASQTALAAATLAEASAAKTARAAKTIVEMTVGDVSDALIENEQADAGEFAAHNRYRDAVARASDPLEPMSEQPPGLERQPAGGEAVQ